MSFYTRLIGSSSPKISEHLFYSLAFEFKRGNLSGPECVTALAISGNEITEANAILTKVSNNELTPEEVHQVMLIAGCRKGIYDTEASFKARLGIA